MPEPGVRAVAIDVALLPPWEIMRAAMELNVAMSRRGFRGLVLDNEHLPHITLTQQFVAEADVEDVLRRVAAVAASQPPLSLRVVGAGGGSSSVWMAIDRTPPVMAVHRALMEALRPLETRNGDHTSFVNADARPGDVAWVSSFRDTASFSAYTPHITLGHSADAPSVAPRDFMATRLAVCHLGKFCTCVRVLGEWSLT